MLWRRPPQIRLIPQIAPVPDAVAVRRAVLQASWRRDRWVARRRVWLRWLVWVTVRYLMPALLVFGLGAWLWLGVLTDMGKPLDPGTIFQKPTTSPPPAAPPVHVTAPVPATPPPLSSAEPEAVLFSPEGEELAVPVALRFESRWAAPASSSGKLTNTVSAEPDTPTRPNPI
ncbi:MAG: hypothetical protein U1D36_10825 [Hydrogenophaga sp.]|uniref:hypothetical protein n=1 Tax=Hydrogenophaga sp. TaxID=1904254 RepID=UPI00272F5825|nr:hypothetical protein [Hydrogenophaga sp.]MDP2407985.1 hypothetical protein [Hydrogenophaga sp.]MDZ4174951.1 hypothetical protein [Hydrogenophaga sp.]